MKKGGLICGGFAVIVAAASAFLYADSDSAEFKFGLTADEQTQIVIVETEKLSTAESIADTSESIDSEETNYSDELIDLSTAEIEELCELDGIGEKTAELIVNYRNENGGFSEIDDLLNIKGIGKKTVQKIKDYVYISNPVSKAVETSITVSETNETETSVSFPIDLSTAGIEELCELDGIGEKTAELIVNYRNENGGFSKIDDLLNIKGIGEKTVEKIKGYVYISSPVSKAVETSITVSETKETEKSVSFPIDLSTASIEELCELDGIGEKTAELIVNYRNENGGFSKIDDLLNIKGIGEKTFEKIKGNIYVSNPVKVKEFSQTTFYEIQTDITDAKEIENENENANENNIVFPININTAGIDELTALDGIGEKTAQKIIDYRNTYGNFETISDIMNVSGIGEKKYESIKDKIYVEYVESNEDTKETEKPVTNLVNINTADIDELMTLKGIGEKKAQNIIDYRNEHGRFKYKTDLLNVKGISEKIFEEIMSLICV